MNRNWSIIVLIAVIGASAGIFGFSDNQFQTSDSDIDSEDFKSQRIVSTLNSESEIIEPTTDTVTTQSFTSDFSLDELNTQSYAPILDYQKAHAVSSTQSSLSVTTWESAGNNGAFDSSWNHFSFAIGSTQISFVDISDNSKKTWTLPNDNKAAAYTYMSDVDSNGNLFFGQSDSSGDNKKLTRLNPSTNVFTEIGFPSEILVNNIFVDSNDKVFFLDTGSFPKVVRQVDADSKTTQNWRVNGNEDFELGASGNFYVTGYSAGTVERLDVNTNIRTTWNVPGNVGAVTDDSSGNIFFTTSDGIRSKVGRINISDNTLTEWVIPNSGTGTLSEIAVDSAGNVFFNSNGLTRLVPSTDIFTIFPSVGCANIIEIDSSDTIHCSSGQSFSEIT
jgi:streptogramin lyase